MVPCLTHRLTPLTATKPANSFVRSSVCRIRSLFTMRYPVQAADVIACSTSRGLSSGTEPRGVPFRRLFSPTMLRHCENANLRALPLARNQRLEPPVRLLVIEDDPDLNRQLATALADAGYVVDR